MNHKAVYRTAPTTPGLLKINKKNYEIPRMIKKNQEILEKKQVEPRNPRRTKNT